VTNPDDHKHPQVADIARRAVAIYSVVALRDVRQARVQNTIEVVAQQQNLAILMLADHQLCRAYANI
jgi:hypothetical protein